jgi:dTDP-4-dehydrorhamnose 3,5-epimerase-like enzyme
MSLALNDTFDYPHILELDSIGSSSLGYITVAEFPNNIPFEVKRTYWTYYTPNNVERGNHAHKQLQQLIISVAGVIEFDLESQKGEIFKFKLDNPNQGLYIPKGYWRIIHFSHNAVLLCLASLEYDANDYIRDYNEFKNIKIL